MDNNENNEIMGDAVDETTEEQNTAPNNEVETPTDDAEPPKEPETDIERNAKSAPMADDLQQRHGESHSAWRTRLDAARKAKK